MKKKQPAQDKQYCRYFENKDAAEKPPALPEEPIDKVIDPLKRFLQIESVSGIVLIAAAATALALANSAVAGQFLALWETKAGFGIGDFSLEMSLRHWINDGLMAVFFFVVGLEIKRELVSGELNDIRKAVLPLAAAVGGMLVPAAIYLLLQHDRPAADGWGIPMATDIAFVVGILAILKDRIPPGLRIMLLSLAIADDIGAILVVAIGYTDTIHLGALALAFSGFVMVLIFFALGIRNTMVYAFCMALVWMAFHESGIHAAIAGVIFGLLTPTRSWVGEGRLIAIAMRTLGYLRGEGARDPEERYAALRRMEQAARKTIPPLERFENEIHVWSGFLIMPLFALANAGVALHPSVFADSRVFAVVCGLVLGKPLGIVAASWLAVVSGLARLPRGVGWGAMAGAGCLAGIGFTMSLFIAGLAFAGPLLDAAKIGILAGSLLSAVTGTTLLSVFLRKKN